MSFSATTQVLARGSSHNPPNFLKGKRCKQGRETTTGEVTGRGTNVKENEFDPKPPDTMDQGIPTRYNSPSKGPLISDGGKVRSLDHPMTGG